MIYLSGKESVNSIATTEAYIGFSDIKNICWFCLPSAQSPFSHSSSLVFTWKLSLHCHLQTWWNIDLVVLSFSWHAVSKNPRTTNQLFLLKEATPGGERAVCHGNSLKRPSNGSCLPDFRPIFSVCSTMTVPVLHTFSHSISSVSTLYLLLSTLSTTSRLPWSLSIPRLGFFSSFFISMSYNMA